MKTFQKISLLLFFLNLITSCHQTQSIPNNDKTDSTKKIDLSKKWYLENTNDYIIFEQTTNKMLLRTTCGLITSDYIQIDQAILFNQPKQYFSDCTTTNDLKNNLLKIVSFKFLSADKLVFYDNNHKEKLILYHKK